jgi:hypothetical protein
LSVSWSSVNVHGAELPVFKGQTIEDYVAEWRNVDAAAKTNSWRRSAIAATLERSAGGRPDRHPNATVIQKFCKDVGISRQTFHRYSRTYRTFAKTCNTGCTSFFDKLTFKHHAVAATYFADEPDWAARALAEAHKRKWSANDLSRALAAWTSQQSGPRPVYWDAESGRLRRFVERCRDRWPPSFREKLPGLLRSLANDVERHLTADDDLPKCLRELTTPDFSDAIGLRDAEVA